MYSKIRLVWMVRSAFADFKANAFKIFFSKCHNYGFMHYLAIVIPQYILTFKAIEVPH